MTRDYAGDPVGLLVYGYHPQTWRAFRPFRGTSMSRAGPVCR